MADSTTSGAPARLGEGLYLVRTTGAADDDVDGSVARPAPPRPLRRPFVGSGRYFAGWIGAGAAAGVGACVVMSAVRSDGGVVWTERSMTWLTMLSVILGALAGACCALAVDAVAGRRHAPAGAPRGGEVSSAPSGMPTRPTGQGR